MAETNPQAGNPSPASPATPATPATPQAGTQPATTPQAGEPAPDTIESLRAKLAASEGKLSESVNAEKNLRARLKEAEDAEKKWKDHETSQLSEAERLKQQLAENESAAKAAKDEANKLRAQVVAQANGYDPDAATLWLGTQNLTEYTDETIKNALAKAPAWVKAQQQPGVTTPTLNPTRQDGLFTQEQINAMSPQQIAANYDKVMASMRALQQQ